MSGPPGGPEVPLGPPINASFKLDDIAHEVRQNSATLRDLKATYAQLATLVGAHLGPDRKVVSRVFVALTKTQSELDQVTVVRGTTAHRMKKEIIADLERFEQWCLQLNSELTILGEFTQTHKRGVIQETSL